MTFHVEQQNCEMPTRPALRWHGSKWRIAPWVISHFPPHKVYVEPFGGGAGVLLQKQRCPTEIYNDLDRDLVTLFEVLRDRPNELAERLALTPYARDEYAACYEPSVDAIESSRRFVARSFMGQSSKGAVQRSGFDTRVNLQGLSGMVVLSGYPSALYDEALRGWRRTERKALADGARERTEVLWINPACAARLDAQQLPLLQHQPAGGAHA